MYRPRHFDLSDTTEILDLVRARSLGTLVVHGPEGFEASPLPWVVRDSSGEPSRLVGHLVRSNPLVRILAEASAMGAPGIVTFDVADGYVSPSLYPTKAMTHEVVPTWNYLSAHLHGSVRLVDDVEWIAHAVAELTARHEGSRPEPWNVTDAPREYLERMYRGIIGVEMVISRVEGKAKLSQNRSSEDREAVTAAMLEDPASADLGRHMRERS